MTEYTLTEMTDLIGSAQRFSFSEMRGLHRQLKGLTQHGLIRSHDTRGLGERAADLYDLHAVCMGRVFAALMTANWEVRAFRQFRDVPDAIVEGPGHRYVSGLENAVAAAIEGKAATSRFEILDRKGGVRGYFEHSKPDPETTAKVDRIIADRDSVEGGVVATVTLHINALIQPILDRVEAN